MRTNIVLPVWVPPPEVRPAAGLILLREAFVDALDNPGFERKIREHQPKTFDIALTLALRLYGTVHCTTGTERV